ncbi:hypothetical protein TH47_05015 [Thalassospira sp. MCCC 1A02803]|nr:hypothetical protein TH47_05015 [Thalassospira sp. MCCC 1A02803]
MFFMKAQQHLRIFVAQMINKAVMQPTKTGTGIKRYIFDIESTQHLRDQIAPPQACCLGYDRPLDLFHLFLPIFYFSWCSL